MITHENDHRDETLVTVEDGCLVGDSRWFTYLYKIAELASDEEVEWAKKWAKNLFGDDEEEETQPAKVSKRKRQARLTTQIRELQMTISLIAALASVNVDNRSVILDTIKRKHPDLAWW